jgi:hypothetical protein
MTSNPQTQKSAHDGKALHVSSILAQTGQHAVLNRSADFDEEIVVALGYKQEFKRYDHESYRQRKQIS